jgi:hypothetical protein
LPANDPDLFSAFRISGASIIQRMTILAVASMFAAVPAAVHFRNDVYVQDEHLLEATAEEAAFLNKAADHLLSAHLVQ